jgi:hypothetical protein
LPSGFSRQFIHQPSLHRMRFEGHGKRRYGASIRGLNRARQCPQAALALVNRLIAGASGRSASQ